MQRIRTALTTIEPGSTSHKAQDAPDILSIYPVVGHDNALSFDRPLVIGNRGMGKSFWAAVLSHQPARERAAVLYPRARLQGLTVRLGFHESAGKTQGDIAPSQRALLAFKQRNVPAEAVWSGVLLHALSDAGLLAPTDVDTAVALVMQEPLTYELRLREADAILGSRGERFLLLFDALDRLSREWNVIRNYSRELLRLALDLSGFANIRAKIFMRSDQFGDQTLMNFQDASKLKTAAVRLDWARYDLYGLLFSHIWNDSYGGGEFRELVAKITRFKMQSEMPTILRDDEPIQARIFSKLAGEFMGTDHRRGRTYSWLHQHLADAFDQTSPRSFLLAVRTAAEKATRGTTAIDYNGIKEGVVVASTGRVDELGEDNPWIKLALQDLAELEVPCAPSVFVSRWRLRKTVGRIESELAHSDRPGPLTFESTASREEALLLSLIQLGVVERRTSDKINMPDLFRVAARIKRRGGVRPPSRA